MRLLIASLLCAASLHAQDRVPVLVELFTSEGCSSCPSADTLLAELQRFQPVANVNVIVLSEHVDYWNSLGWKDPFSAKFFSQRQQFYAQLAHTSDVYTPEAVIDGRFSTVGSNRANVLKALASAGSQAKSELHLSIRREAETLLIDVPEVLKGNLWVAVAQTKAVSHVAHGENKGLTLEHVDVVRALTKVADNHASIQIDKSWPLDLSLIAFVQDPASGRILQLLQQPL